MSKQHLDALAALARPLIGRRAGQCTGDLPGMLVDAARDLARRRVGTALFLRRTGTTVKGAAQVNAGGALVTIRPHFTMLARNLLYTGVTRGRRLVVLFGQKKAIGIAVRGGQMKRRWTKLREWLAAA
ncbi:hypothetical protein JH26_10950 [Microvirga sp. BSC39]|nr:hypothetical protein JH26_10950 [Microvirga sp. BSC39]